MTTYEAMMCIGPHPSERRRAAAGHRPVLSPVPGGLRHEAFFYVGEEDFLSGTAPFIEDAIAAEEPTLVMVGASKLERLRARVGEHDGLVSYADMELVGRNPARIIPAWKEFVDEHASHPGRLRGIGEPVWAGRSPSELDECQLHEALLNVAFSDGPDFWLMCPYDSDTLARKVLNGARRTHPVVSREGGRCESIRYSESEVAAAFEQPLPEPVADDLSERDFAGHGGVAQVRQLVRAHGARAGVPASVVGDLALAASEVATNTVIHGGGSGSARVWQQDGALICEITDRGRVDRPLAGRERPSWNQIGGRGLWMANQLCRLVQIRSGQTGTAVRLHADV